MSKAKHQSCNQTSNSSITREIIFNNRDAVVFIHSRMKENEYIHNCGNGFFIKNHFIVCPADVVLINDHRIFDEILVTISNVEATGKSYAYLARVLGVDGSSNIAVLYIEPQNEWNKFNPNISKHPHLRWSKSRNLVSGDTVYIIGNMNNNFPYGKESSENGSLIANVADNRYVDYDGLIPCELLLLSNVLPNGKNCGLAVLDQYGAIVGMTTYHQWLKNIAISEFFMRKPIRRIIQSFKKTGDESHYINKMTVPYDWYIHIKSYIGICGRLMNAMDYTIETENKEIVGYYVKNSTQDFEVGDIIISIEECPLGTRKGQTSPTLIMYRTEPGSNIKVRYKKRAEYYNQVHTVNLTTKPYPSELNYPWYCYDTFSRKNLI